ncbi:hypothetical protein [Cerasicoccus frondis]|uniref:hypothetical protein n=1 Tax=Cerasicoccus frondis TaxID=490090 RepID=UPI0028526DE8|nr:hypothetical protein [Cerasicoccus frondis]
MNIIFKINRKYENNERPLDRAIGIAPVANRKRRRRLGHALGYFNGDNWVTFYLNLIFR